MYVHCSNEAVPMMQSIPQPDSCKCMVNAYLVPPQPKHRIVVDLNGRVTDIAYWCNSTRYSTHKTNLHGHCVFVTDSLMVTLVRQKLGGRGRREEGGGQLQTESRGLTM